MLSPTLARRLAAYSAATGLALAAAPLAGAQVVFTDVDPDNTLGGVGWPGEFMDIDFDEDGVDDIRVRFYYFSSTNYPNRSARGMVERPFPQAYYPRNSVLSYDVSLYSEGVARLSPGDTVAELPSTHPFDFVESAQFGEGLGAQGECQTGGVGAVSGRFVGRQGFAGVRFLAGDGQVHFGWVRLGLDEPVCRATVYSYAYESQPDTPIVIFDPSVATLSGAVNQTAFPASGGRLRYTATAENTYSEPVAVALRVTATRLADGAVVLDRRLGARTLDSLASATETAGVRVPAGLPGGTYEVVFTLEDPGGLGSYGEERYTVTKAPAAAGVPVASLAVVGEAGTATHALSAPVPNPSTGRTSMTLSVAEAQAVRVTVLDALGREVAVLHDGPLAAGQLHRLVFDGSGLPAGVYVVRAVGEVFADTRTLTLTR